ncbi:Hint domain-containing protein [Roseobacter sp. YSTF-M11]|uniref:Hint domain-containing protein n=1 Tax=Roseobacter insulae TaxID=2859783 RepID=A0A9X1FW27_9RHOB|nr:Hint domain-containing protein [Roseobacter insulae]MBW4707933.1 Hint domain-containing protein [Roseobacter insulae]
MSQSSSYGPGQTLAVHCAADMIVSAGANEGDGLSFAEDLELGDVYRLKATARTHRLTLARGKNRGFRITDNSEVGTPGAEIHLDCAMTLMSPDAPVTEVIVLVQLNDAGAVRETFALPLAPLIPQADYQLVGIDTSRTAEKIAQIACVSFARGTHITMGSGRQKRIEELQPGDPVLTRDDGVQQVRWIGRSTQRAVGDFAPIRIQAGVLNNTNDLIVSPNHRLFIYQRTDRVGAGRSELLVKARHLVNGQTVTVMQGGFVDYHQLLFDTHQIIYAEGIAAESMLADDRTAPMLSPEASQRIGPHDASRLDIFDVPESLLDRPDMAALLRKASLR